MQTVRPTNKNLFCKPVEASRVTKSGILLADNALTKPSIAEVINSDSAHYQSKQQIIYKSYAATDIKVNGDEYIVIAEEDVLGIVVDTNV